MMKTMTDKELAYVLLRLVIGISIYMHGAIRVVTGLRNFVDKMSGGFAETPMPMWIARGFAWPLPFIVMLLGAFLLLGIFMRQTLACCMLLTAALTFGTAVKQDWMAASIQLSYTLAFFVLLAFREWNRWSVDDRLGKK